MKNIPIHPTTNELLINIPKSPSQAYLFYGQKGIGKLFFAKRTGSQILGFQHYEDIDSNSNTKFIYIAPAESKKDITIEQIRGLSDKIWRTSTDGDPRKVIIINGIDRISIGGANALLKNLEDSPVDVTFILIAEYSDKVLPTIRSRTQLVHFKVPDAQLLENYLIENYSLNKEEATELVNISHGSPISAIDIIESGNIDSIKEVHNLALEFIDSDVTRRFVISKRVNDDKVGMIFLQELSYEIRRQYSILMQGDNGVKINLKNLESIMKAGAGISNNVNTRLVLEYLALNLK